jgi:threo-3-hydroxy-L-aspartate ammonia-lyase
MSEHRPPVSELSSLAELAARLGPADVRAAAARIRGRIAATPTLRAPRLDALAALASLSPPGDASVELFLKAENLQRIGAFKARGALHSVGRLLDSPGGSELAARGVITFSSGNHAQAVALAAREYGIPATIAMPIDAPAVKLAVVRELGAEVVMAGTTSEDRRQVAYAIQAETGAAIIQPFDDPDIICGQGTATLELIDAAADLGVQLDAILVPVGGGGVIAGACLAAQAEGGRARVPVFSVEPHGCDALARSLEAGERVRVEPGPTLADGLKPVMVGALNYAIAARPEIGVAGSFRVDDEELGRALVATLLRAKLLVEPSGAAGIAAVLREAPRLRERLGVVGRPLRCGVILTGGNVDPALVAELLQRYGDLA